MIKPVRLATAAPFWCWQHLKIDKEHHLLRHLILLYAVHLRFLQTIQMKQFFHSEQHLC